MVEQRPQRAPETSSHTDPARLQWSDLRQQGEEAVPALNRLIEAVGWGQRATERWSAALAASSYSQAAVTSAGEVVAFGRILEDGVMCMFYDIAVHPEWQHRGLGRQLMTKLVEQVRDKNYVSIGLFVWEANPSAASFYRQFGFEHVHTGMELHAYMTPEG